MAISLGPVERGVRTLGLEASALQNKVEALLVGRLPQAPDEFLEEFGQRCGLHRFVGDTRDPSP